MFHSMTLARAIQADRVREIERSMTARRLLAPAIDPLPVLGRVSMARPVLVERRSKSDGPADVAA